MVKYVVLLEGFLSRPVGYTIHNTHHPWSWTPLVFSVLDLIWGIGVKGSPLYLYYAKAEYKPELSVLILSSQSHFMLPI
jgi:hypothetical protein